MSKVRRLAACAAMLAVPLTRSSVTYIVVNPPQ